MATLQSIELPVIASQQGAGADPRALALPRKVCRRALVTVQSFGAAQGQAVLAKESSELGAVRLVNGVVQGGGGFYVIDSGAVPQSFLIEPDEALYAAGTVAGLRLSWELAEIPCRKSEDPGVIA